MTKASGTDPESRGRTLAPGSGQGPAVVLAEPLSLWGGLDPQTGVIVERRHPQAGASVRGCVVVMPAGRGSSSSSTVLAEAIRNDTAPAAIVLRDPDPILALGSMVASELYSVRCPVVVAAPSVSELIRTGDTVQVMGSAPGDPAEITIRSRASPPPAGR